MIILDSQKCNGFVWDINARWLYAKGLNRTTRYLAWDTISMANNIIFVKENGDGIN